EAVSKALDAIAGCLLRLRQETYKESSQASRMLALTKDAVAHRETLQFDGVEGAVAAARMIFYQHLPIDWPSLYAPRVQAVTVDALRKTIDRYLEPQHLHVVLVAEPAALNAMTIEWPPRHDP